MDLVNLDVIDRILGNKTLIYITHHDDQERNALKKIVLEAGKLAAV